MIRTATRVAKAMKGVKVITMCFAMFAFVSWISCHNSSLTSFSSLNLGWNFSFFQGEISPGKWVGPVNRAHVKRSLFYSKKFVGHRSKNKLVCENIIAWAPESCSLWVMGSWWLPVYTICDMKFWMWVSSQLDPQRIMSCTTFVVSVWFEYWYHVYLSIWKWVSCL